MPKAVRRKSSRSTTSPSLLRSTFSKVGGVRWQTFKSARKVLKMSASVRSPNSRDECGPPVLNSLRAFEKHHGRSCPCLSRAPLAPQWWTGPQLSSAVVAAVVLVVAGCAQGSHLARQPALLRHALDGPTEVTERPCIPAAVDAWPAEHLSRTSSEDLHLCSRLSLRRHRQVEARHDKARRLEGQLEPRASYIRAKMRKIARAQACLLT